jgi:hypothetical protein
MSLKDAAAREAVLRTLYDAIGEELKAARAEVQAGLDSAQQDTGVRQITATLPDGTVVAKVNLSDPKPEAIVIDEDKFTAWVRDHHPQNIVRRFITEVRPAFTTALLAEMTAAGVAQWCDRETGEVHEVPGVEIRATRSRTHSVRFEKSGRADVAEAWRSGRLGEVVPQLALPSGES